MCKCKYLFRKVCLSDNLSYTHQRLCNEISIEDCYFKQLKQLEKEDEKLKKIIKDIELTCHINECLDCRPNPDTGEPCTKRLCKDVLQKIKGIKYE